MYIPVHYSKIHIDQHFRSYIHLSTTLVMFSWLCINTITYTALHSNYSTAIINVIYSV